MSRALLSVSASVRIGRPVEVVRSQFCDVRHHASHRVHRGVEFTPLSASGDECRFRFLKTVWLLGIPLVDEVVLKRLPDGTVTEEFVSGSNTGGRLTSRFRAEGKEATEVETTVELPLGGVRRLVAPLLRRLVLRRLATGIEEDRHDLEERGYPAPPIGV